MSSAGILFRSKLLPDMLSCDKLPDDAKDLLQSFHDRYPTKNIIIVDVFISRFKIYILELLSG